MSAIESLLSRLEEKMTPADEVRLDTSTRREINPPLTSLPAQKPSFFLQVLNPSAQNEEEKLRRKLSELAGNLSDKGLSSDDEPRKKASFGIKSSSGIRGGAVVPLDSLKDKELSSSSDEMPTEAQKV